MRLRYAGVGFAALAVVATARPALADDAACIAASEQSLTLRQQGKLHDALKTLAVCADAACPDEVKAECSRRIDGIGTAMPTLVLEAKDGSGNDLFAVTVTMDGAPLAAKLDGRPVSIDPGEHTFRFETAGQPPVEKKLVLREGEKDRRESVVLGPPAPAVAPPPAVPIAPPPSTWTTRKSLAVASGGVGLVGIGLGIVFGLYASSSQSREKSDCSTSGCPSYPQGNEDYDTAKKDATGSMIAFIAGAAFLAGGAVLWLTAPTETDARPATARRVRLAPMVVLGGGGFVLGGDL
jgi:hypothetical protein